MPTRCNPTGRGARAPALDVVATAAPLALGDAALESVDGILQQAVESNWPKVSASGRCKHRAAKIQNDQIDNNFSKIDKLISDICQLDNMYHQSS